MAKISVIVPVYKVEKYLCRCVDSILAQTFTDFELILVDDGSPDNCGTICDEYAEKDIRVRVIHQTNQGQAAARNRAVAQAKGSWISFVDSDDMIHPDMLETLYCCQLETEADIVSCNAIEAETVSESFWEKKEAHFVSDFPNESGMERIYRDWGFCYWVVWGKMIRREILMKYPMAEGRVYEDNAVVFKWLLEAGKLAYTDVVYYFYQVNYSGTTKSTFSAKQMDYLWALNEQLAHYIAIGFRKMEEVICLQYMLAAKNLFWNAHANQRNKGCERTARKCLRDMYRKNWQNSLLKKEHRRAIRMVIYPLYGTCKRCASALVRRIKKNIGAVGNDQ